MGNWSLTSAPPLPRREIGSTNRALLPWLLLQRHKHNKACCPLEGVRPSPQQVRASALTEAPPSWLFHLSSCCASAYGSHQVHVSCQPFALGCQGLRGTRALVTAVFCCASSMHECWTAGVRVSISVSFYSPCRPSIGTNVSFLLVLGWMGKTTQSAAGLASTRAGRVLWQPPSTPCISLGPPSRW